MSHKTKFHRAPGDTLKPGTKAPLEDTLDLAKGIRNGTTEDRIVAMREAAEKLAADAVPALLETMIELMNKPMNKPDTVFDIIQEVWDVLNAIIDANPSIRIPDKYCGPLIGIFKSSNALTIDIAKSILSDFGDPKTLPYMIEALHDKDRFVISGAANVIEGIAKKGHDCSSAEEPLFNALKVIGAQDVRKEIKAALAASGVDPKKISAIIDFQDFTDPHEQTRLMVESFMLEHKAELRAELEKATGKPVDDNIVDDLDSFMRYMVEGDLPLDEAVRRFLDKNSKN
jgi:hypothetical protein